jgi:hypothetical protein
MKVSELTHVLDRLAQMHARLGSAASSEALGELAKILSTRNAQDVSKLVAEIRKPIRGDTVPKQPAPRKRASRKK